MKKNIFIPILFSAISSFSQINLNSGLTGYFPLNGNATDMSSTAINGTNNGASPVNGYDNSSNGALNFTSSQSDYVNAGNNTRGITDKMSISLWFRISGTGSYELIEKYNYTLDAGFYIRMINGQIYFHGRDQSGVGHAPAASPNQYNDGQWHHLIAILDVTHWMMYVDCQLIQDYVTNSNNPDISLNYPLIMGKYNFGNDFHLNGDLDEVRIYNRVLNQDEICYLCGNANFFGGLTGYFPLNGNTNDMSPTAINATNNGATSTIGYDGTLNGAYSFNATQMNYINAGNDGRGITNQLSLSMWFRISSNGDYQLAEKYNWNLDAGFYIRMINGQIYFHGRDQTGVGHAPAASVNTYNDGLWHHLVAIVDQTHWILNIDCEEIQDYVTNSANPDISVNAPLTFGKYNLDNNYYLDGALDDIRLYNRPLSSTEICNLCHNTELMEIKEESPTSNIFIVYPNPAKDIIRIGGIEKLNENYTIKINNLMGQELINTCNLSSINVSELVNGVYILSIYVGNNKISSHKIVKE